MMIILDTNVVSEIISKPHPDESVQDWIISQPLHGMWITSITVAEMLFGIALLPESLRKHNVSRAVNACIETFRSRTLNFGTSDAANYAAIMAARRHAGRPIGVQDAMIAAIARANGASLATRNVKDFEGTGVKLINPWDADHEPERG